MIIVLFGIGTYFVIGYSTFRVWTWRCRPQNGTFGNEWGNSFRTQDGWFTPSWVDTSSGKLYGDEDSYPRGQAVQATFWQSVLIWPLVWLNVFVVKTFNGLETMSKLICRCACESATKQLSLPQTIELPLPQTIEEKEFMDEGNREVEKLLTEEN